MAALPVQKMPNECKLSETKKTLNMLTVVVSQLDAPDRKSVV